jgi:hypothetical protein
MDFDAIDNGIEDHSYLDRPDWGSEHGKPLKYTPDELKAVISRYFEETPIEKYTITGLALLVGTKQLLANYAKREDYKDIVKMARLVIENSYELSLREKGGAGNIFVLKNFGWVDKSEVESTHIVNQMPSVEIGGKELELDVGEDPKQNG